MAPSHECPGGCGRRAAGNLLACQDCWYRLPTRLRAAVRNSFRRHAERHLIAVQDATNWYTAHPLSDVDN